MYVTYMPTSRFTHSTLPHSSYLTAKYANIHSNCSGISSSSLLFHILVSVCTIIITFSVYVCITCQYHSSFYISHSMVLRNSLVCSTFVRSQDSKLYTRNHHLQEWESLRRCVCVHGNVLSSTSYTQFSVGALMHIYFLPLSVFAWLCVWMNVNASCVYRGVEQTKRYFIHDFKMLLLHACKIFWKINWLEFLLSSKVVVY